MSSDWPHPDPQSPIAPAPAVEPYVGSALAALAHRQGLQSGYVPPEVPNDPLADLLASSGSVPESSIFLSQPSGAADTPSSGATPQLDAVLQQPHPASYPQYAYPQPPVYPPQPYGAQPAAYVAYPQPYPPVQQPMSSYPQPSHPQPSHPQPSYPDPRFVALSHQPPFVPAAAVGYPPQSYPQPGVPVGHYPPAANTTHPLQMQQQGYAPLVEPVTVQGYSAEPPNMPRAGAPKANARPWEISDDAPRYAPPGTDEVDIDPFGLNKLPENKLYQGPKEVPSEAVYGLLFGLCSLLLFPLAFVGFVRARRGRSMIESSPNRYSGRIVALTALSLNIACPIISLLVGAYLFKLI